MTLILSEKDAQQLLDMGEVVSAVEECFRQQALLKAVNSQRTRSIVSGSVLSVMHASAPYLGRAGAKCYLSSRKGTRFVFVLFRLDDGEPLAVTGADMLGRYRTGAASAVATRHMLPVRSFRLAVCGSGRQALTQVLAMEAVASIEAVSVWSPTKEHRESFVTDLGRLGLPATAKETVEDALRSCEVASTITSSREPFLTRRAAAGLSHLNLCGSNSADRVEAAPEAVADFQTIAVDDAGQSIVEAGDLILAAKRGLFTWDRAVELKDVVSGRVKPSKRTLFKSSGVAIEDVAVASLLYDRAVSSGEYAESEFQLGSV